MPDDHTSFFVQARSASRLLSGLGFQAAARAHFIERQLPLALKKSSSCAGAGKYRVEGSFPRMSPGYSCRRASIGFRREAFTAGTRPKMMPIRVENATAITQAGIEIATGVPMTFESM